MLDLVAWKSNSTHRLPSHQGKVGFFDQVVTKGFQQNLINALWAPPLLGGDLTLPNVRILEEILRMVRLLQPAAFAICDIDSFALRRMPNISSCFEGAS